MEIEILISCMTMLLWKTLPILLYFQPQIILCCGGRNSEMGFAAYSFTSRIGLHLDISSEQYLRPNISHIPKVSASTDGSLWFKDTVVILAWCPDLQPLTKSRFYEHGEWKTLLFFNKSTLSHFVVCVVVITLHLRCLFL